MVMKSNDAAVLIGLGDCLTNRGRQRVQEANGTSEEVKKPLASGTSEDAKKPPASGTSEDADTKKRMAQAGLDKGSYERFQKVIL